MITNVLTYLDRIVKEVPEKTAFADVHHSLTFSQLYQNVNSIGTALHQEGYYREPVLIYMEKSADTIAAFFGVIRSGCFYVPIDAEMPASRIELIIQNCHPRAMIYDEDTKDSADRLPFEGKRYSFSKLKNTIVDAEALKAIEAHALDVDPIYIVFTSGSTGVPKGVTACHRSVLDYVNQLSETLHFNRDTIFGNQTPLYFDACLKEIYPTIMFGATTWLIPKELFSTPKYLVQFLNEKKINTICWVVSALTMISAFNTFKSIKPEYLKTIAFGSEVFPIRQFRRWQDALPDADFTNLYGPTEGTGMSCYYHVPKNFNGDSIPIGVPFKNTEVLLLKDDNTLAEPGEEGEICLRGTCVTLGYYNNPEKTREVYVQNPLNHVYPEIIYRTGDMGKRTEDGNLMFGSRRDYQIKHMGHRIELGEIEADVNKIEEVKMCGCVYDHKRSLIKLFYTGDIEPAELTDRLNTLLPRYMMPNRTVHLTEIPFTANGKIDRKALENMQ
ncbi:amino acid adenylation domain-containing protein [Lactimicrobium massiliense]|uniref:amino acid adenylation domain-containing protein n=1 Tax=Lactimicrobium massiliense TaxID=2161814 RepID=UPI001AE1E838|nr:amino acid adenylation domain-containing protein [Lactimicrobium massiliense]